MTQPTASIKELTPTNLTFWDIRPGMRFIAKGTLQRIWTIDEILGLRMRMSCGDLTTVKDFQALKPCIETIIMGDTLNA